MTKLSKDDDTQLLTGILIGSKLIQMTTSLSKEELQQGVEVAITEFMKRRGEMTDQLKIELTQKAFYDSTVWIGKLLEGAQLVEKDVNKDKSCLH